jgi:hypothetical protein
MNAKSNQLPAALASIKRYSIVYGGDNTQPRFVLVEDSEGEVMKAADVLALPPPADGAVTVPRIPTAEIVDSVRYMLTGIELHSGRRTIGNFRTHCDHSGVDFSHWPSWATDGKHDDEHLTKAGLGILLYATFINAAAYAAPPADSAMVEALKSLVELCEHEEIVSHVIHRARTLLAGRK